MDYEHHEPLLEISGLSAAQIDAVLADFRGWLEEHAAPGVDDATDDRLTLAEQFTALRHEVNLLTRATRTQTEQTVAVVAQLQPVEPPDDVELRSAITAAIEAADTLDRASEALERFAADAAQPLLEPGFFRRLFAPRASPFDAAHFDRLAAMAEGVRLSRLRFAAALGKLEVEPIDALGQIFDPEIMEALEAVPNSSQDPDTVVEVIRTGYLWKDRVFRCAQVRVAK